ncbi:MAG TPA: tetraacyldisaccharide 4'-kinase [Burkholderiaceae bacterium]|nr:tetraacyldisaccharide 4'-kinase [Burkholderiaceae bacterium]
MLRTRVQLVIADAWQRRGVVACLLTPLAAVYYLIYVGRCALYAMHLLRPARLDVPVVVIGNLYVGGTGKTPLTVELVRALTARGWRPGIVSRGYGAEDSQARLVRKEDAARRVGDEPLLIVRATISPVAIGKRRVEAARRLRAAHPECDVIVADDGLQHLQLARDMEIALINHRRLGNGWLLPAGPLREPRSRLDRVDAIVLNGPEAEITAAVPHYQMRTRVNSAFALHNPKLRIELASLAAEQRTHGWRLTAAAGIGAPDRFFSMLRAAGLAIEELPLADHFDYQTNPFSECVADRILITEKDAVKCADNSWLASDPRLWVVPLVTEIDSALIDAVVARISATKDAIKNSDGPSPA